MKIPAKDLREFVTQIFVAAGCNQAEADCIAEHLVEANLVGHDSHGVIRVSYYTTWLSEGKVYANRDLTTLFENDSMALVDGQLGFGQSIGKQVMKLGIEKCDQQGVSVIALRNSGHLGRIGHWAEMAVRANKLSLHFVNTSGLGMLVAPTGGINRRLSANPVAVGIPVLNGNPIIFDISTSVVAEGKLKVALNKNVPVPDGCIIDAEGKPTNDPKEFYGPPPGAILPFGGHKGYGLGIVAEILAGALTTSGCSVPNATRLEQGMLTIIIDPARLSALDVFSDEVSRFVEFVKSSETVTPDAEILVPGDIERRNRQQRLLDGIELDENSWKQLCDTANLLEVSPPFLT
jgi:uncharacterized oxidoreductase